jgi:hypothetical protein
MEVDHYNEQFPGAETGSYALHLGDADADSPLHSDPGCGKALLGLLLLVTLALGAWKAVELGLSLLTYLHTLL